MAMMIEEFIKIVANFLDVSKKKWYPPHAN